MVPFNHGIFSNIGSVYTCIHAVIKSTHAHTHAINIRKELVEKHNHSYHSSVANAYHDPKDVMTDTGEGPCVAFAFMGSHVGTMAVADMNMPSMYLDQLPCQRLGLCQERQINTAYSPCDCIMRCSPSHNWKNQVQSHPSRKNAMQCLVEGVQIGVL